MKIAFTICSINYLSQAKTLGDSLKKYNPEYKYIIGLLDRIGDNKELCSFVPYEMLEVETICIEDFEQMCYKYDITELNTSVKPFYIEYLFKQNPEATAIIYLDPDIVVFDKFSMLEDALQENNIVLTPHFFTPIYDNYRLSEPDILNAGVYNLGFIAVSRNEEVFKFLLWWQIKLKNQCFIDLAKGLFVDQLWINFAPIYYNRVSILRHLGYNAAYWNLHERVFLTHSGKYYVNTNTPLVFYHYSGYNPMKPDIISRHQDRYSFAERIDIIPLFDQYRETLLKNNKYEEFSKVKCYFMILRDNFQQEIIKKAKEERMRLLENKKKQRKLIPTLKRFGRRLYDLI